MYSTRNPKTFKFDNKRKTDIAIHYLPYDETSSEYKNEDYLFEKYNCYAGAYRYSNKMKSLAKKRGKQLFGNSYKFSIAMEK